MDILKKIPQHKKVRLIKTILEEDEKLKNYIEKDLDCLKLKDLSLEEYLIKEKEKTQKEIILGKICSAKIKNLSVLNYIEIDKIKAITPEMEDGISGYISDIKSITGSFYNSKIENFIKKIENNLTNSRNVKNRL